MGAGTSLRLSDMIVKALQLLAPQIQFEIIAESTSGDKVLNKPKAAGLRAGPTLVWPELEKACLVIVLSVNEICAVRCPAQSSSCLNHWF